MELRGVLFESLGKFGARVQRAFCVPWEEDAVLSLFSDGASSDKSAQRLWAAARYQDGSTRGLAGLLANTAAVLDGDCCDVGFSEQVLAHLKARGLAHIFYTSWSHLSPEKVDDAGRRGPFDCFRIVLPYSREVTPAEHSALVQGIFGREIPDVPAHYAQEVEGVMVRTPSGKLRAARPRGWDPVSWRPAQGFYVPAPHSVLEVHAGDALDVDSVVRRPTTPQVRSTRLREWRPPTSITLGAMSSVDAALRRIGLRLSKPNAAGWRRSVCPCCKDPSPSFTVRANGDALDVHCHAQCSRHEIFSALGLHGEEFSAPSDLQENWERQLARQPPLPGRSADVLAAQLTDDLRKALESRKAVVIKSPAGVGKSHAAAKVISEVVERGERIVYATQEHAVAQETRSKLSPEARARSVHLHSPLIAVGGSPRCARAAEVSERVFEYGTSLQGSVCPRCPLAEGCEALAAARRRQREAGDALAVFVSHSGIQQALESGDGAHLVVDEMPAVYERLLVTRDQLREFARGGLMLPLGALQARLLQEVSSAILHAREPGVVSFGTTVAGPALALLEEHSRLRLSEGSVVSPEARGWLKAADALLRLAHAYYLQGLPMGGWGGMGDVWMMLPSACHQALLDRQGVLLSATPLLAAMPGFAVVESAALDGARVRRVMVLRKHRGSGALLKSYYDDEQGIRIRREPKPGEGPGVPWPVVDAALERAREEAQRYENKRILFVTFKSLADVLRKQPWRIKDDIDVGHFGALRGKNDWMEGRDREVSVVYCLGAPRGDLEPTLAALGLFADAKDDAWVDAAAGELTQAEGRLRLPRRTKPCSVIVEGGVAPAEWNTENVDEVIPEGCDPETETARAESLLSVYEAAGLGYDAAAGSIAAGDIPNLSLDAMSKMSLGRRRRIFDSLQFDEADVVLR